MVHTIRQLDAMWRAANYLSAGQLYLADNPLLREPLRPEHIKPRPVGHWGTCPGLNLVYAHLNRAIRHHDLDMVFVTGPGHGAPALLANTWLENSYSELYPAVPRDADGMRTLFRQFSFPGGVPSHVGPNVPGSLHEGGELGYSLAHAYGAVLDNPGLIAACVIGDGEAETGPLAASWHANKLVNPVTDGTVLPILHLNGYKIANPTLLSRIPRAELDALLRGYGHVPYYVTGSDPPHVHRQLLQAVEDVIASIRMRRARAGSGHTSRPLWPMIVLRTPKGWTGPATVDGLPVEDTWRAHQLPLTDVRTDPERLRQLETWLRSYRPDELFDADGRPTEDVTALLPAGDRRMGANPHTDGGRLLRPLRLPDPPGAPCPTPGAEDAEPTRVLGRWLADVVRANTGQADFRVFGPDETRSNKLDALYAVTGNQWTATTRDTDVDLRDQGRIIEVLSEHLCQGLLEGYLLTGRHGLFNTYEAFAHVVDSMVNQFTKWITTRADVPWRRPTASLNYLLTSHVWRQDHNGFSHQDPGFIDHVLASGGRRAQVYLPPDTNCLLAVARHSLAGTDRVNVIVAGKTPTPTWLSAEEAELHCARGAGAWHWAGQADDDPDVVLACAGDAATVEVLAAADLLRTHLPSLRYRVVNVVDLVRLQPAGQHPHGMSDEDFDDLFTADRPVIFAYHGYPWLIHRLAYRRTNHHNIHVRGYTEHGTTTTPFDMLVRNNMDRYQLVIDVLDRVRDRGIHANALREHMLDQRLRHHRWILEHGADLPEVRHWRWPGPTAESVRADGFVVDALGGGAALAGHT